jgi:formamidopyrimidine-DNA glycosylase
VPELPEVEALRRTLDGPDSAAPVERAGPAHVATVKTFDPPLAALEGRRLAGARRRGTHLLFPTEDGELVLHVHLMTAGRLRLVAPGGKEPAKPAFRLGFADGSALVLTEGGTRKQARVGLYRPAVLDAELAHLGPDALGLGPARLGEILAAHSRRLHALLRDQRVLAGIGRAWANEVLWRARLSPYALSTELSTEEVVRLAAAIDEGLGEGLALREAGKDDDAAYRVHDHLGKPCPRCGSPIARVDFEEHTIYYCPTCQTGGRTLKDRRLSRLGIDPASTTAAGSAGGRRRRRPSRRGRGSA